MIVINEENQNWWVTFIPGVTSCFLKWGVYLSTPPPPPVVIGKQSLGFQVLAPIPAGQPLEINA